jgi:hypothetical protein
MQNRFFWISGSANPLGNLKHEVRQPPKQSAKSGFFAVQTRVDWFKWPGQDVDLKKLRYFLNFFPTTCSEECETRILTAGSFCASVYELLFFF